MSDLDALEAEQWLALDELPPEAEVETCLAIFADVHAEAVAAVMAEHPNGATPCPGRQLDREARPKSGPVEL